MEIYQLKHFLAVADTASFTKAALRTHITQPALSGSIARLEEELGVQLFTRSRKAVTLTPAGQRLMNEGTQIVRACEKIKADIKGSSAPQTLRLGVIRTFPTSKLVGLLTAFRTELPELQLEIAEGSALELDVKLQDRKLDLLLTILGDEPSSGFSEVPLLEERYLLYVSGRSPLAQSKEVQLSVLSGQPFIVRSACETFAMTTSIMKERGISTRVVCRTNQDDRALELVRAEVGMALMPDLFEAPDVARIHISDFPMRRRIGLRWLESHHSQTIDRFCQFSSSHRWR